MAGCSLLIILMCSLLDVEAEALLQPELMVDRLVITETDSVTLTCQTPPSVNASQCDFYIENQEKSGNCVQTLTAAELLNIARRRSPAEVKVRCCYTVMNDAIASKSPDSGISVIAVNNFHPPKLMVDRRVIAETDSVTLNCQTPSSVSVTECNFIIMRGKPAKRFSCLKTLSGTELLSLTQQCLPAKVDVTCFYLISHPSPQSDKSTITIQLSRPELTVNPLMITETDSVTLNCQTPSSVSVTECYLYFLQTKTTRTISCVENLRGTELLMTARQSSPADVELTCYYDVERRGGKYSSPHSNMSSIRIQNVESSSSTESAFSVTTDFTVGTPPSTLLSASLTSVKPTSGVSVGTTTNTVSSLSTSLTSVKPTSGVSVGTTTNTVNSLSTSLTSVKPAPETDSTDALTSEFPKTSQPPTTKTQQWKFMFVIGPAFGMSVGVILLVAAVLCSRRSEQRIYTRSQAKYAGNVMRMGDFDVGKWLSADNNEADTLTHSTPAADSSNGFVQVSTQKSESENADIYHVYSTIPDEPAASALMDTAYSTIQPH